MATGTTAVPWCKGMLEGMLGCMAVLCPFPAGMCVRCVCARVFPAFPRREAEGDGAPTTEGSRHQPSRLRQKIAVVPALLVGLADPPPAPRSARCVPARHRPGPRAEEEDGTSVWARQGYEGTVPGRGKEMERWGSGVIGLSPRARWPQPGCGACGDQQRLLCSLFSPWSLSTASLTPSAISPPLPSFPSLSFSAPSCPSVLPSFLLHPSSALPSRSPSASSPPCSSLQPDFPSSSWLLLSPLTSWLPPANSVASYSSK